MEIAMAITAPILMAVTCFAKAIMKRFVAAVVTIQCTKFRKETLFIILFESFRNKKQKPPNFKLNLKFKSNNFVLWLGLVFSLVFKCRAQFNSHVISNIIESIKKREREKDNIFE